MIQSMTGFGQAEQTIKGCTLSVEMRSVNHRNFSVAVRLPRALSVFEESVKKKVQTRFERGRIDLSVNLQQSFETQRKMSLNLETAAAYYQMFKDLKKTFELPGEIDLALMCQFRDIIDVTESDEPAIPLEPLLNKALAQAMKTLEQMRKAEGKALLSDLCERIDDIAKQLAVVKGQEKEAVFSRRARLQARVSELSGGMDLDPVRLAQEVAIFAERSDISEERTRLKIHLDQFKKMLRKGGPVGRSLDFLLQEMFREVNTLSAKSGDQIIAMAVVAMKSDLEKMREQVQNIA
ncbi:MAG: YicC/YloC family endoribonuclease [Nitrospiria bacterium]